MQPTKKPSPTRPCSWEKEEGEGTHTGLAVAVAVDRLFLPNYSYVHGGEIISGSHNPALSLSELQTSDMA